VDRGTPVEAEPAVAVAGKCVGRLEQVGCLLKVLRKPLGGDDAIHGGERVHATDVGRDRPVIVRLETLRADVVLRWTSPGVVFAGLDEALHAGTVLPQHLPVVGLRTRVRRHPPDAGEGVLDPRPLLVHPLDRRRQPGRVVPDELLAEVQVTLLEEAQERLQDVGGHRRLARHPGVADLNYD